VILFFACAFDLVFVVTSDIRHAAHHVVVLQAKQDMEQVKHMASGAINKLSNMAGRFMNDLSRY
jgi:hypothetical protein